MRKLYLKLLYILTAAASYAQPKIVTTGNNLMNTGDPKAADIVIGSDDGVRHDGSMMWWSSASASRISNTNDVFYLSVWNTLNANIGLSAIPGGSSYFQGNVGIGNTSPNFRLQVSGTSHVSDKAWFTYGNPSIAGYSWVNAALTTNSIEIVNNQGTVNSSSPTLAFHRYGSGGPQFRLAADGSNVLYLESSGENSARNPNAYGGGPNNYFNRLHVDGGISVVGNVGIGTISPDAKLAVKGTIHAQEVKVDLSVPGPDYVFEKNYPLTSLAETEAYIKVNKHLPDVPSAGKMQKEGIDLSAMNMMLLRKVEELTLHLIRQQKEIDQLKDQVKPGKP